MKSIPKLARKLLSPATKPRFPTEIIQRIIEEVGFEYGPQLKEYISTFKALNSIPELKPIIAKYISIWILYPSDVRFNYLRYSETLRSLRDCTDSFFIFTNDEPEEFVREGNLNVVECGPLIFDVHNYLGLKLRDGLSLGIQNIDVVLEKLILLSDKRPKRILELALPQSREETSLPDWSWSRPMLNHKYRQACHKTRRHDHLERIAGVGNCVRQEYTSVWWHHYVPSIDHQIINWAHISDFDHYPFDEIFRKRQFVASEVGDCMKVSGEFWGPAPFLKGRGCEDVVHTFFYLNFLEQLTKCRIELWSDYQNQLFLSEYYRMNLAAYHDLIETLATEQWK